MHPIGYTGGSQKVIGVRSLPGQRRKGHVHDMNWHNYDSNDSGTGDVIVFRTSGQCLVCVYLPY
jgi:hypothetical protein